MERALPRVPCGPVFGALSWEMQTLVQIPPLNQEEEIKSQHLFHLLGGLSGLKHLNMILFHPVQDPEKQLTQKMSGSSSSVLLVVRACYKNRHVSFFSET